MNLNNDDLQINEMLKSVRNNMLEKRPNGLYLTDQQVSVLEQHQIPYLNCTSIKEILFLVEDYLNQEEDEDLESISLELSEFAYYHETNK